MTQPPAQHTDLTQRAHEALANPSLTDDAKARIQRDLDNNNIAGLIASLTPPLCYAAASCAAASTPSFDALSQNQREHINQSIATVVLEYPACTVAERAWEAQCAALAMMHAYEAINTGSVITGVDADALSQTLTEILTQDTQSEGPITHALIARLRQPVPPVQ